MKPFVRKKLRLIEDELYFILHNDELLFCESEWLNNALIDIVRADYHVSHLGVSHSRAYDIEKDLKSF